MVLRRCRYRTPELLPNALLPRLHPPLGTTESGMTPAWPQRSAVKEIAGKLLRSGMTAEQAARLLSRAVVELVPDAAISGAERTRQWRERQREAGCMAEAELRSQMRGGR